MSDQPLTPDDVIRFRTTWRSYPAIVRLCDALEAAWQERDAYRELVRRVTDCADCGGHGSSYVDDGQGDVVGEVCDCRTEAWEVLEGHKPVLAILEER